MTEKETVLFLDFNNKLTNDIFEKETFIRIANLDKKTPLVQINDTLFEGTYNYALGTNLFFEAVQETPQYSDPFIKRGRIQFQHFLHGTKTIHLKQVKVPPIKTALAQETRHIEFNLDWDYATVLEKFADGSLKLDDIFKKGYQHEMQNECQIDIEENEKIYIEQQEQVVENEANFEDESILDDITLNNTLDDYHKLRELAFRPVKRSAVLDKMQECDPKYKESYEYHNLEKQALQPCDFFRTEPVTEINEETLSNCVDINRCILYGLLEKSSDQPKILTDKEKRIVLTMDNFDNLSLAGKYYVLKSHVENLEKYLKNKNSDVLNTKDTFGRTPLQTLEIYKKLTEAVKKRIEEIKFSLEEGSELSNKVENVKAGTSKENN